jgi:methyltransferase (TIGR00027 family)
MREGRPSFTAAAVSAARAVANVDPIATDLLPAAVRPLLRAAAERRGAARALNVATFGLVDHIELRTRAIDAALGEALARGTRQLVILGAGLDARAWRLDALGGATVFEVDHPWTQSYKRSHVGSREARAAEVKLVGVDFEKDSLDESLAREGHDASAPTFWIWEGVTPYLPIEATRATLAVVAARSAKSSRLAVTYSTPEMTTLTGPIARVALAGFGVIGEPIRGLIATHDLARELRAVGFDVIDDTSPRDWAARYSSETKRILVVIERLAVAERR